MSRYDIYLTFHVLMAIVWLGGGLAISVLGWRIALTNDARAMAAFAKNVEWIGNRIFVPASLALLVLGFLMIHDGNWSYSSLWIVIGLVGFAVTFLTGLLFLGPQGGKIGKLIEAEGVESTAVKAQIRRVLFVSRLDLITLYSIAGNMLVKPTGDDVAVLVAGAVAIVALSAAVIWTYVRGDEATQAAAEAA
jgi:uncharacterized membrane protein